MIDKGFKITGAQLKCDNCDWFEDNLLILETMTDHINRECPECGENLFTFDDYEKTLAMLEVADVLGELAKLNTDCKGNDGKKISGFSMECDRSGNLTITENDAESR
jgi:hypothetical protein